MKPLVLMAIVIAGGVPRADARNAIGIYLTAEDYKNGRLTSESACDSPGHNVQLHDILHKRFIHVTHEGETHRYEKNEIFGFRSCGGRDYRFVDRNEYEILESRELSIYAREVPARHPKRRHEYFFSIGAAGQVLPLTIENLKQALPDNHAFHDALDMMFRTDEELTRYDAFHKMYKVNRLLIASLPATRQAARRH